MINLLGSCFAKHRSIAFICHTQLVSYKNFLTELSFVTAAKTFFQCCLRSCCPDLFFGYGRSCLLLFEFHETPLSALVPFCLSC